MMKQEKVYELLNGYLVDSESKDVNGVIIRNEFSEGRECFKLYEEIYVLKNRLNERLSAEEDNDLEHLIDCMEAITKFVAMKMYEYGALIGE